jgi:hypothetical protein
MHEAPMAIMILNMALLPLAIEGGKT